MLKNKIDSVSLSNAIRGLITTFIHFIHQYDILVTKEVEYLFEDFGFNKNIKKSIVHFDYDDNYGDVNEVESPFSVSSVEVEDD